MDRIDRVSGVIFPEVGKGLERNLNGEQVVPTDASGKEMPVFLYGSTTYVPVRYLSEQQGKSVDWDPENAVVSINDPIQTNPDSSEQDPDEIYGFKETLLKLFRDHSCLVESDGVSRDGSRLVFSKEEGSFTVRLKGTFLALNLTAAVLEEQNPEIEITAKADDGGIVRSKKQTLHQDVNQIEFSLKGARFITIKITSNSGLVRIDTSSLFG